MKKVINSPKAPKAIGPYSQAIEVNGMIYISGQLPVDVNTGKFAEGGIQEQTEQSLKTSVIFSKLPVVTYDNVVKTTCLLSDIANFKDHERSLPQNISPRIARLVLRFAVKDLPMGALVEIEVVAAK